MVTPGAKIILLQDVVGIHFDFRQSDKDDPKTWATVTEKNCEFLEDMVRAGFAIEAEPGKVTFSADKMNLALKAALDAAVEPIASAKPRGKKK